MGFLGGTVVKNFPANARDASSIPGSGRFPGEENGNPLQYSYLENYMERGALQTTVHGVPKSWTWLNMHSFLGLPCSSISKESACNAGDLSSIPGLGNSPGEGNGKSIQYSYLENPMDRGAWQAIVYGVTKSQTCLSN